MNGVLRTLASVSRGLFDALIAKPVRERGLLWTVAVWVLVLSTISFWGEVASRGLLFAGLVWFFALLAFARVHRRPKRMARPIPYGRRRR